MTFGVDGARQPMREAAAAARLRGVQCLRAIAALLVLACHLQARESFNTTDTWFPAWLGLGGSGIHLFFVISGFIMVHVTRGAFGSGRSPAVFLYNRVTRIYPPLWLFTALMAAIFLWRRNWSQLAPDILGSSLLLYPVDGQPTLSPAWTLIHEMYFYLVFSMFLLGPARLLPVWLAIWAGLSALPVLAGWDREAMNAWAGVALNPLTFEFILGCLVGLLVSGGWRRFGLAAFLAGWAGLIAVWTLQAVNAFPKAPGPEAEVLRYAPFVTLIVYGAVVFEMKAGWSPPRPLAMLGDWSYALYLCHWPLLHLTFLFWRPVRAPGPADNVVWYGATALVCVCVAAASYYLYERPALRLAASGRKRLFGEAVLPAPQARPGRIW